MGQHTAQYQKRHTVFNRVDALKLFTLCKASTETRSLCYTPKQTFMETELKRPYALEGATNIAVVKQIAREE